MSITEVKTINQLADMHQPKQIFQHDGELWDSAVFHNEPLAHQFVMDVKVLFDVVLNPPLKCQSPEQGKGGWMVLWPITE